VFDSLLDRQRYEVLNFGVPSYGMLEVRDQLRDDIVPFHPTYLFLMFYNGNDFTDTYLGIDRFKLVNGLSEWDSLAVNGRVPSALPAATGLAGPALKRWVHHTLTSTHLFLFVVRMATTTCKPRPFLPGERFMSFTYWSRTDSPPHLAAAVDTTMRLLDDIRRICQANEIRLVLVSIPTEDQVYADREVGDGYDIRLPQKYLAEFARTRAIPFLDLLPPLRLQASQHDSKLYVPNDPHFTNEGHLLAGLQLSSFFRSLEDRGPPAKLRP
jgi:hypothetical protein